MACYEHLAIYKTARPSESYTTDTLHVSVSTGSTVPRKAKPTASERSRLPQHSPSEKTSLPRLTATTSTNAFLET